MNKCIYFIISAFSRRELRSHHLAAQITDWLSSNKHVNHVSKEGEIPQNLSCSF